ncbi:RloB domain-containing protein [candidate division KSB1 bacterium]|nr:RloB domain-containing protein [candidate division KSB1 bacterium]
MNISRKKRPLDRKIKHFKDTKLFIIATEGKETEKQYFDIFRNSRVQVKILPACNGHSAPNWVIDRLDEFAKEYNLEGDDELWIMFDVDKWGVRKISQITRLGFQKGYGLAISNPCFEVWLFLHFTSLEQNLLTCQDFKSRLRQQLGSYNSARLHIIDFKNHIHDALIRAREIDINPGDRWPQNIGTHVYKVVEKII